MAGSNAHPEERELFDLPLAAPAEPRAGRARKRNREDTTTLDLFPADPEGAPANEMEAAAREDAPAELAASGTPTDAPQETEPARLGERVAADLLDLGVALAVLAAAWIGALAMGIRADLGSSPAFLALGAVFSFLYQTVPLAFWGATPGMARRDLVARTAGGGGISFRQAMLRWAGWAVTLALGGVPYLVALSGRSLADHASASRTLRRG